MSDRHDELLELCAGRALGALSDADRGRLERHLDGGCDACEQALREFGDAAIVLSRASGEDAPDPALKARILKAIEVEAQAVGRTQPTPGSTRIGRVPDRRQVAFPVAVLGWAAAAAFAIVTVVQFQNVSTLGVKLDEVRAAQSRLERQLAEEQVWTASMASPAARVAFLAPTPAGAPEFAGWALYDTQSTRAIVVLENLAVTPGHDYELWAIRAGGPQSLGLVRVEPGGRALVRLLAVENPSDLAAFAVSKEAAGGSPDKNAPHGPVVMAGVLGT